MACFADESAADPLALRALTDELMFEIRRLSGQSYVDRYAKRHDVVGGSDIAAVPASSGTRRRGGAAAPPGP